MTEQSLVYNSNGIGLTADSVENKLAELFADTHCLVNLKTGKTMLLSMAYLFATCLNDVNPEMFDAEEIKKLPVAADPEIMYILGFDKNNSKHTIIQPIGVNDLTELIESAYASCDFLVHDIYDTLRNIAEQTADKYFPGCKILRSLLEYSNAVIYKNGTAIIATVECKDTSLRFFEIAAAEEGELPMILLNFGSPVFKSIYPKPANELFGLRADEHVTGYQKKDTLKNYVYELCLTKPGMQDVIVFTMQCDGYGFDITDIASYPDYRGIKGIVDANYNDGSAIIGKIMEYNIDSHMENLFSMIE